MFGKKKYIGFIYLLLLLVSAACGDFNKIVKSTDYEFKYKKAVEFYESGEYSRASTLLAELVNIYRGTSRADDIYYYHGKGFFAMKDYLMAGHWFTTLAREFPKSEFVEECQYMIGYCFYMDSPKPRLDQTVTQKAIDALQLYINLYPSTSRAEEANRLIIELRDKLVYKSFLTGKLYYDLGNYKAAVVALTNSLKGFPDTRYREDLTFMLLDAKYNLAIYSTEDKKELRLSDALDEYFSFVDEFPDSKYRQQAEKYHAATAKLLNYDE
ncbi:MAG: outer membrane protein assembly factor BamD [Mangrovibacterium sp.]|nr:outer membrane protein assembly factor BamD [Mangrovibacterium sp.]